MGEYLPKASDAVAVAAAVAVDVAPVDVVPVDVDVDGRDWDAVHRSSRS